MPAARVFEEASSAFQPLLDMKAEMHDIEHRLAERPSRRRATTRCSSRYSELQDRFRLGDGYSMDLQIATVLRGLGFAPDDVDRPCETFSGGWQMRIALAKLLLGRPNLLLLDEPTNHLDLDARNWLEEYLTGYPYAVILVSHDRYFLDAVVTRITDLEPADAHRLRRQLQQVRRAARRDARAAAPGQARAGRGSRAREDVHRSVPLPGDEGRAGAEPHQDAREGRADRGAAGAQADPLHVSGVRQERPHGVRAASTRARPTVRSRCSAICHCTSSAATASRSSGRTAPASRR